MKILFQLFFNSSILFSYKIKLIQILFLIICFPIQIAAKENPEIIRVSTLLKDAKDSILYIEKLPAKYSRLIVDTKCSLNGKTLVLPSEAELLMEKNGYIDKGIIKGNNSVLSVDASLPTIGLKISIIGTWRNSIVYDSWFDFDHSTNFISNQLINNILALTDDIHFCHIFFQEDRTYFFELPYKGEANLGNTLPYSMVGKEKKRKYSDLYKDSYSFIRIFTIPSNTHLTIQNHLQMLPTNQGAYFIFWEYGKQNVTIDGKGVISGDIKWHIYNAPFVKESNYYGEWGHIFCCRICSNFSFKDITIEGSFGDCILYTADYSNVTIDNRISQDLKIDNIKIKYARRNGIAIGAKNVEIQNSQFEGCGIDSIKGTAPKAAIDFEPDGVSIYPETGNENVYMRNCIFVRNKHDISSTFNNLASFKQVATHIIDCEFTAPLRLNTTNWIEFVNCTIPDITNYQNMITEKCPVRHVTFKNCTIAKMPSILLTPSWNNSFIQCDIIEINSSK